MGLKIGDRVRIREDLAVGMSSGNDNNNYVVGEMLCFSGKVAIVTSIEDEGETYHIDRDNNEWHWTEMSLVPYQTTNADYLRMMSDDELSKLISSGEWSCICPMCGYYGTGSCVYDEEGEVVRNKEQCIKGALEWLKQPYKIP